MDGPCFDALAKAWSTTRPRRALLKGLAGSIGAGLLVARGAKRAAAACTQYGRTCGRHGDCCSENCVEGKCACRDGKSRCGKRCVDLRYNETHCGACDTPCPEDQQCRDGQCSCAQYGTACTGDGACCSKNCEQGQCACPKGRTRCGKRCVNTATDEANCGRCGNACGDTSECRRGRRASRTASAPPGSAAGANVPRPAPGAATGTSRSAAGRAASAAKPIAAPKGPTAAGGMTRSVSGRTVSVVGMGAARSTRSAAFTRA
jgi:hypothetical protein